ncbi:hypothetical protein TNCV_1717821 [Trichonephila clavipes]|nr:hypothetical protein TNCV_1717821 [Trichonephila clavipes]
MTVDLCLTGGQLDEEKKIRNRYSYFRSECKICYFQTFVSDYDGQFSNCGMKEFVWEGWNRYQTDLSLWILRLSLLESDSQTVQKKKTSPADGARKSVVVLPADDAFSIEKISGLYAAKMSSLDMKLRTKRNTIPVPRRFLVPDPRCSKPCSPTT